MHIAITVIFFAVVIFIKLKMPMWKGKYSEKLVNNKIQELPEEYVVFNDLLFESNGYSTQIDHIVVSPYGVFVIETKGYKGWIWAERTVNTGRKPSIKVNINFTIR